jgi:8-oxo-dGTP pyrophosphatase MutT (NUDIX family)
MGKEQSPGIGIGIAVTCDGKVLMGRRSMNKGMTNFKGEGKWTFPGGKCKKFKTLQQNAAEEIQEETGIVIEQSKLEIVTIEDDMEPSKDSHFVTIGFEYKFEDNKKPQPQVMEPEEIEEWQWFDIKNGLPLPENTFPPSEKMLQRLGWRKN